MGSEAHAVRPGWTPIGETVNTDYFISGTDIMVVRPRSNTIDNRETARINAKFQMDYVRDAGRRFGIVVLLDGLVSQDSGARRVYASEIVPELCFGTALVVSRPIARAIGSFFLGLTRPRIRTRMFDSFEAAVTWLDTMRTSEE